MTDFGLIETIRVDNGIAVFANYHTNRLFKSLKLLEVDIEFEEIYQKVLYHIEQAYLLNNAKNIRLRIEVELTENKISNWVVNSQPISTVTFEMNEIPLKIGIYNEILKAKDYLSNLKSTERAIYNQAKSYALDNQFDDVLVFNSDNALADATIYNVFLIKNNQVYTPRLEDAPVNGILRQFLLDHISNYQIIEKELFKDDILQADEVFLTNAVRGIQSVGQIGEQFLESKITNEIYEEFKARLDKTMN